MSESGPNDRLFRVLLGLTAALVLAGVALSLFREEPEGLSAAGESAAALAVRTLRVSPHPTSRPRGLSRCDGRAPACSRFSDIPRRFAGVKLVFGGEAE
jgi:hypothetical protein